MTPQTGTDFDARTLLVDLFSTRSQAVHPLSTLCRAGAIFGISDTAVRTALLRLTREGKIESAGRGLYRAVANSDAMRERVLRWRNVLARQRPTWSGKWILALAGPSTRVDRTTWRRTLRAMELDGLRQMDADAWVRPDNLMGGAPDLRERMRELGAAKSLLVARLDGIEPERARQWAELWDVEARQITLSDLRRRLAESATRLAGRVDDEAAAETLTLGRTAVRAILRDPLLPAEIAPGEPLRQLIEEMIQYDQLGKRVWRGWISTT